MRRTRKEEADLSQIQTSLEVFLEDYNRNIPVGFPRASVAILKKFQSIYPSIFKHGNTWSIALYRKKVIDWLSSYRNAD
ncbi:MAG: hypothetical protein A3C82_01345 [Candidatus Wildermuthbacteria bacterium RIFCSPHIGHO2_02_FULL_47_12]|uniref:Uncharacterized protein n=1 Tax=Candidatus Wildermuthbacteria bacterium RIFCSPHIGHO2_02_FULL_47_12 TaxID=1802451 RepID=A0A1G2R2D9_9BACT|nr:MAG: hypothetical protein A3C82_01345 [Candidatus Wildermuthbacteria bacterium RIFCSPHIGHO2_02_FULL_47_12]